MPFSFDDFPAPTDLIYGLARVRMDYRRRDAFSKFSVRNNIDSYHITNDEIASVGDPEKISYKNEEFINYISNHEQYSSIQSVKSQIFLNQRFYENEPLVLGRKCKAGLGWAAESDIHVNFLLDGLDMNEVVDKIPDTRGDYRFGPPTTSYTSRELRYLYRNRNNEKISSNVQFWNDGKPVAPPWESDPETWSRYKPKSEAHAGANIKASAEVEQAAKVSSIPEEIMALKIIE